MTPFITIEKVDAIEEIVNKIELKPIFYSIEDIQKYIEPDIEFSLPFAIKLSKQPAKTKQEKEAKKYLLNVISEAIKGD